MAKVKRVFFVVALLVIQSACLTTLSWGQPNGYGGQGGYGGGGSPYPNPDYIRVIPSDYYNYMGQDMSYSGTNCVIGGPAVTGATGASITFMTLEVNGVQVASATFPHEPNNPHSGRTLNATFASTHFTDGASITWKLTAEDNLGNKNSKTHFGTVYNKAGIWVDPEFSTDEAFYVKSALQTMHHTVNVGSSGKSNILQSAYSSTSFHMGLHGGYDGDLQQPFVEFPIVSGDPLNPTDGSSTGTIIGGEIGQMRSSSTKK
jgi:hypothetical protein